MASMDPLTSFTYLTDNLPEWISKLEDVAQTVEEKRKEFANESPVVKKTKADSVESIHADEDKSQAPKFASGPKPAYLNNVTTKQLLRYHQQKRSITSGRFDSTNLHTRSMIVVYYDSSIQENFEMLVRNVGTARNNLRKARMATSINQVAKARFHIFDDLGQDGDLPDFSTIQFTSSRLSGKDCGRKQTTENPVVTAIDNSDKNLEAIQCLCEVAAHQYLRDGDCSMEITACRGRFEEVSKIAKEQVEKLKREKEEKQEKEPTTHVEMIIQKQQVMNQTLPPTSSNLMLEVDDGASDTSVEIDLSMFRSSRARRVQV
ncbi:MAG: hypothetical protein M1834_001501 [Cirrosporium novae-zelandiae]|nr:MAG: hypothetical protein M1834_004018 [Cirrosporium novae-zelandiae]KAI9735487.1 MAG: hypothetical protein M1834_001501 [Cirrosporium novae-zelandiae]